MLAIRIEKELEEELIVLSKELNRTKTDLVKEAIKKYLDQIKKQKSKEQLEAIDFLLSNPIDTKIKDLKAIQKVKSEKNISWC